MQLIRTFNVIDIRVFMFKIHFKYRLLLLLAISSSFAWSQLTTSTAMTPEELVENVLVGNGVSVSNVTFTGSANAIGSFDGSATNVGLNSGIILTTGTVLNTSSGGILGGAEGPHGPNDSSNAGVDNNEPGYQPLTDIAGSGATTYNAAILEFDFVPLSDSVHFRYVFGSEEYPEYVGSEFNDVFAFFISGPGFGGTYNMATIPNNGGPVSINNINNGDSNIGPCQNCSYYINNGTGSSSPQDGSEYYIQYDGFTVVLEASAEVQCGETYHLKIAIADVGDGAYDSGIFLEANSLVSYSPLEVDLSTTLNLDNNEIAEGCETATVTLSRHSSMAQSAISVPITVSGTASEGVDYESIPTTVSLAAGQTSTSFTFDIYSDGITEGTETINLAFNFPDPCGNDNFIYRSLNIKDILPLTVNVADKSVHCSGDEVTLTSSVSGGLGDYSYSWSTGDDTESIIVSPGTTTTYDLSVTDVCITTASSTSATVTVPTYPPLQVLTSGDTTVLCPNTPVLISSEASGGEGTYSYNWTNEGEVIGSTANITVSPMVTTEYTVKVTDGCGATTSKSLEFTVTTPVLYLEMSPDQLICPGDTTEVSVEAFSGLGDYTYYWYHSGETTSAVDVSPNVSTNYTVAVEDGCHTYHIDGTTLVKVVRPNASFNTLTNEPMENLPVYFQNTSTGSVAWEWDFFNGETSTMHSPGTTYSDWGWHDVELVAINEIGCTDTVVKTIYIKPEFYFYAPNAFTPDGNQFNNTYAISMIGVTDFNFNIYDRWGELIYYTTDPYFEWDGTYKGQNAPDGAYVYRAIATDREGQVHEYEGHIILIR